MITVVFSCSLAYLSLQSKMPTRDRQIDLAMLPRSLAILLLAVAAPVSSAAAAVVAFDHIGADSRFTDDNERRNSFSETFVPTDYATAPARFTLDLKRVFPKP